MEATIFTGWIYDHLLPHAARVKVAHPLMLRAIAAAKRKNDRIDAGKIANCLRCDFLPECHMASTEIRYRRLVVKQMVQDDEPCGVGPITAVTWALEIGDFTRFTSNKQAISYCGLCGDEKSSADKMLLRMPISKQRNKHIQRVLIEAAKLAPRESPDLAMIRARELEKGNPNRATLAVARKIVVYMLAVERRQQDW